jgi:hypothetical protein
MYLIWVWDGLDLTQQWGKYTHSSWVVGYLGLSNKGT